MAHKTITLKATVQTHVDRISDLNTKVTEYTRQIKQTNTDIRTAEAKLSTIGLAHAKELAKEVEKHNI